MSHGEAISALFSESSSYWDDIYTSGRVKGTVYSSRQSRILQFAVEMAGAGTSVVEIGAGAGHLAVELARRGFEVVAVDLSEAMLDQARDNAERAGVGERVRTLRADAMDVPLPDGVYDAAIAVGLLPWVEDPCRALHEMARLVKPGGYVLLTTDNRYAISRFLDPAWHPSLRAAIRRVRSRLGQRPRRLDPGPVSYSWSTTRMLVAAQGLVVVRRAGVGFGPFTFLFRQVLPNSLSVQLERILQSLADQPSSRLWRVSLFHAVASRKPHTAVDIRARRDGSMDNSAISHEDATNAPG